MLRRRRRFTTEFSVGMNDIDIKDCYAAAYYLYRLSESISRESEDTMYASQISLFFRLAGKMKRREEISALLADNVNRFEEKGKLTRLKKASSEEGRHAEYQNLTVLTSIMYMRKISKLTINFQAVKSKSI